MRHVYWTLPSLLLTVLGTTSCDTEAFCFDCASTSSSGGADGGAVNTGGVILNPPHGDTGGRIIIDDNCDADLDTDPLNCGACDFVCEISNAFPECQDRFCVIDRCALGFYDIDGQVENGCEYECEPLRDDSGEPLGEEQICNEVDDDCDGLIDETFDTERDVAHCGGCNQPCSAPANAKIDCEDGECVFAGCQDNWEDTNADVSPASVAEGTTDGCECNLIGVELCNFVDDDCDGSVDEGVDTESDPLNCGTCGNACGNLFANALTSCADSVCAFDGCLDGFYDFDGSLENGCEYECTTTSPGPEICDGEDNDCNGFRDDTPVDVGEVCGTTTGECEPGSTHCIDGQVECVGGIAPTTELCDGLDNDCDGEGPDGVDEGCPALGDVQRLDTSTQPGRSSSAQLTVAVRSDQVYAAWLERESSGPDIYFNYSDDAGRTWQARDVALAATPAQETEPWLFTSQSRINAVLGSFQNDEAPRRIHFATDELAPDGWTDSEQVEADPPAGSDSFFGRGIVANDAESDQIVIVWQTLENAGTTSHRDVYLQASEDGGLTWLPENLRVNERAAGVGKAELPSLATDGDGKVFIAWRDAGTGRPEAWFSVYDFGASGDRLGVPQALSSTADDASVKSPTLAADGSGNVHVLWTELPDENAKLVKGRSSADGGDTFDPAVVVNQPPEGASPDADMPSVTARDGVAVAVWEDTRAGQPNIYASRYSDGVWGGPVKADGGERGQYKALEPKVVLGTGDQVFVTYRGYRAAADGAQADVYFNFSDVPDELLFQPQDTRVDTGLHELGERDSFGHHLLASGNDALVIWLDNNDGPNADPYARIIDFP